MAKQTKEGKKNIVTKSNDLIEANYKTPLSIREQKIITYIVSQIEPDDVDFEEYEMSVANFTSMMGLKDPNYSYMRRITKELLSKVIEIRKEKRLIQTHWLSSVEYKEEKGIILFTFHPTLKPYLLQLKDKFTSYRLINILQLKSGYSIRFYELLKKWENIGGFTILISELRDKLGLKNNTYKEFANFRQKILDVAQKELKKETDIYFKYDLNKKGRKYHSITFHIKSSKKEVVSIPHLNNYEDILGHFMVIAKEKKLKINTTTMKQWITIAHTIWGDNYQESLNNLIHDVTSNKKVKNPAGLIVYKLNEFTSECENGESIELYQANPTNEVIPEWFKKRGEEISDIEKEEHNTEELRERIERLKHI
ncbi:replication initiation protein [Halobacillus sp. A1]|uniref:replication initiation protein n=1 Tax=Halobacillus sp. A1 TaxID=2880262 RepID=UPI0020A6A4E9|nr:replication initiation protein [Halobacillus sp. A1]MCP3033446.1 replication initiation protein [Halobacillus sp. A1]